MVPVGISKVEELPGAGGDDEGHVGVAENGELTCLLHQAHAPLGEGHLTAARVLDALDLYLAAPHISSPSASASSAPAPASPAPAPASPAPAPAPASSPSAPSAPAPASSASSVQKRPQTGLSYGAVSTPVPSVFLPLYST